MGAKQTKCEDNYHIPNIRLMKITESRGVCDEQQTIGDPRSPSACRTPLNVAHRPLVAEEPIPLMSQQQISDSVSENPFSMFRKRLLKGLSFNDPRSPQLNRTPLIFDEALDKTLNLDDTFADLFVESRAPLSSGSSTSQEIEAVVEKVQSTEPINQTIDEPDACNNSLLEIISFGYEGEETMQCDALLQQTQPTVMQQSIDPRSPTIGLERTPIIFKDQVIDTMENTKKLQKSPIIVHQPIDPRSPTYGIDRTPIIFSDDDEMHEDQMLENILATLSLNLSNASSVSSFASAVSELPTDELASTNKPKNKHLDRVRLGKERVAPRKPARAVNQRIYEDRENLNNTPPTTPKENTNSAKRTPLSCLKNRPYLRSDSVENLVKSKKPRLPLQSFDDRLKSNQSHNISSNSIMQHVKDFK